MSPIETPRRRPAEAVRRRGVRRVRRARASSRAADGRREIAFKMFRDSRVMPAGSMKGPGCRDCTQHRDQPQPSTRLVIDKNRARARQESRPIPAQQA
jgi:hypothetical protein